MRPAALLLLSVSLFSQAQVSPKGAVEESATASVAGIVVAADTGEPLKRALIAIWSDDNIKERHGTQTDGEGRFGIRSIQPGRYHLSASHRNFIGANYGESRSNRRGTVLVLEKRQEVRDVIFRLRRPGVITGRVVDDQGEPARISVNVWAYHGRGTKRKLSVQAQMDGNDLGEYRIYDLEPGKYYVSVAAPSYQPPYWAHLYHASPAPESAGEQKARPPVYPPVFYPNTTDPSQATAVEVKAGEELRLDFSLIPVSPFRVRGRVLALPMKSNERLIAVLSSRGLEGQDQISTEVQGDGRYEFAAVIPGSYQLAISGGRNYFNPLNRQAGKRSVEVINADLDNVDLVFQPFTKTEIKGKVTVEDQPAAKLGDFTVHLIGAADDEFAQAPWGHAGAQIEADGSFSIKDVPPGEYSLEINNRSYSERGKYFYIRAGRYGGRPVVDSRLTVTESAAPRLELAVSSATARLEGFVLDEKNKPVAGPTVVAVSQTPLRGRSLNYRVATTDQNGRFVLPTLKPDTYKLFAFADATEVDGLDAEFLQPYENSAPTVVMQARGTVTVNVKLIAMTSEEE